LRQILQGSRHLHIEAETPVRWKAEYLLVIGGTEKVSFLEWLSLAKDLNILFLCANATWGEMLHD